MAAEILVTLHTGLGMEVEVTIGTSKIRTGRVLFSGPRLLFYGSAPLAWLNGGRCASDMYLDMVEFRILGGFRYSVGQWTRKCYGIFFTDHREYLRPPIESSKIGHNSGHVWRACRVPRIPTKALIVVSAPWPFIEE